MPPLAELAADSSAARVIADAGRTIGRVVADIVNCLNPAAVLLGGELGTAGEPFVNGVRESIDRYAQPASAACRRGDLPVSSARAPNCSAVWRPRWRRSRSCSQAEQFSVLRSRWRCAITAAAPRVGTCNFASSADTW